MMMLPTLLVLGLASWPLHETPVTLGGTDRAGGTVLLTDFGGKADN